MSRTDAHAPYWVQLHYEGVESHDHRSGDCDYKEEDKPSRPTWRIGRHHNYTNCKKCTKYTVVCKHIDHLRESYRLSWHARTGVVTETYREVSPKRHTCEVFDEEGNLVREKPALPTCHEHSFGSTVVNRGDNFENYRRDSKSYSRYDRPSYTYDEKQFAEHVFDLYVFHEEKACACDDFPSRRFSSCEKTTASGKRYPGYSYYCNCGWCSPPRPGSRTAIKQALKEIAHHGFDEDLEDYYLDFEDVYHGRDYRQSSRN